jgi:hypothetical protein
VAGVTVGLAAYQTGSGPIGAILVCLIVGALTLVAGQIVSAAVRSPRPCSANPRCSRSALQQARRCNFPSLDLMTAIREEVDFVIPGCSAVKRGSPELIQFLKANSRKADALVAARQQLARVIPSSPSIDAALFYLSQNAEAVELGKIAILRRLFLAERNSLLRDSTHRPSLADGMRRFFMAREGPGHSGRERSRPS